MDVSSNASISCLKPDEDRSTSLDLTVLYRGPLSSCNYDCHYCPFAKHHETAAELKSDRLALERFVTWCCQSYVQNLSVFFTPWGEGLTRPWYRQAIMGLSRQEVISKVAIQTNLSCKLDWLQQCNLDRVGLWCTFHPNQTTLENFVVQCRALDKIGAKYSVGIVGLREYWGIAKQLRAALPEAIYMWVNAFKDVPNYYDAHEVDQWTSLDPHFPINNVRHPSFGKSCRTGHSVISVDGEGNVQRCHFIKTRLGNIYEDSFDTLLIERPCSNVTCGCHIGFVHMNELRLYELFGDGVLERRL